VNSDRDNAQRARRIEIVVAVMYPMQTPQRRNSVENPVKRIG